MMAVEMAQPSAEELAVFAAALAPAIGAESVTKRAGVKPPSVAVLPGPVTGIRLVSGPVDAMGHAVPVSYDAWELRLWFAEGANDPATGLLALHAAAVSKDPVVVAVRVERPPGDVTAGVAKADALWVARATAQAHLLDPSDPQLRHLAARHYVALTAAMEAARRAAAFAPLLAATPALTLQRADEDSVAYDAHGTWHGDLRWELRYRRQSLYLHVSANSENPDDRPYWWASLPADEMPRETRLTHFGAVRYLVRLAGLLERAPFEYEFDVTRDDGVEEASMVTSWGHSEDDAREKLKATWPTTYGRGSSTPVENLVFTRVRGGDDREFPEQMPDFTIGVGV